VITFSLQQVPGHDVAAVEFRLRAIDREVPGFLRMCAYDTVRFAKKTASENASNVIIKRRTGNLVGTLNKQKPVESPGQFEFGMPTSEKASYYGRALDEGRETIVPRVGKFLRIPLPAACVGAAGVDLYAGQKLRAVGGFFVQRAKNGKLYVFRKPDRKSKTIVPWYLLVSSVHLPRYPWWSEAMRRTKEMQSQIVRARLQRLEKAAEGASEPGAGVGAE
jgi:hypothetical protein